VNSEINGWVLDPSARKKLEKLDVYFVMDAARHDGKHVRMFGDKLYINGKLYNQNVNEAVGHSTTLSKK
jgi:hypothetical protein